MSDEIIENTFQVADTARLVISNIRGSITIQPGEQGVIEVKAVKHGNFDSGRYSVEMSQDSDGSVRIETRPREIGFGLLSYPPKVDYSVRVPQGIRVDTSCVSSAVNISGLNGVFKCKTVSGDIDLANMTGPFNVKVVSGDISGTRLSGMLDLDSVSGRVRLLESNFPSANASTVSGDLVLQTPVADGPYHFSSVSGTVRMLVPADTHCDVELHSVSGSIRSSLPATTTRMGHGIKAAQILGGGTLIRLKSVSGDLLFETEGVAPSTVTTTTPVSEPSASHFTPVPPVPPAQFSSPEPAPLSTSEILQRIERGEMTVDEAIRLMKNQS